MTRYFKTLLNDGRSPAQGVAWSLPTQNEDGPWTPGEWVEVEGPLKMCNWGLHAATEEGLVEHLSERIFDFEVAEDAEVLTAPENPDKICTTRGRLTREYTTWNERTARLFACDCAEDALHLFEQLYPNDDRPRKAIETARLYADGRATLQKLQIAESAAGAAVRNSAGAAAWAAAGAAAGAAAWAAAWAAAGAAAAARNAAKAADMDSARTAAAARNAAQNAARNSAGAAAGAAAKAAIRKRQTERLMRLLDGELYQERTDVAGAQGVGKGKGKGQEVESVQA